MRYSGTLIIQDTSKRKYTRHSEQKKKTEISVVVICVLTNLAPARCLAFTPLEEPLRAGDTVSAAWHAPVTVLDKTSVRYGVRTVGNTPRGSGFSRVIKVLY